MTDDREAILLLAFGNPSRLDDGIGPSLADAVGRACLSAVSVQASFQPALEDAATIADHDVVIFADADQACPAPFELRPLAPNGTLGFSTHRVEPAALLAIAHELFGARTRGYVLGIRGYRFDGFGEGLSERAQAHLAQATAFLERLLRSPDAIEAAVAQEGLTR